MTRKLCVCQSAQSWDWSSAEPKVSVLFCLPSMSSERPSQGDSCFKMAYWHTYCRLPVYYRPTYSRQLFTSLNTLDLLVYPATHANASQKMVGPGICLWACSVVLLQLHCLILWTELYIYFFLHNHSLLTLFNVCLWMFRFGRGSMSGPHHHRRPAAGPGGARPLSVPTAHLSV